MKWQKIKSAPKDGTEIQLATMLKWTKLSLDKNEPRIGTGFYNAGAFWWDESSYVWRNRLGQFIVTPTHWMPLPEPPTTQGEV